MEKIQKIISPAVPLDKQNIDTDQIIPARYLKATDMQGFGDKLFYDWRYDDEGIEDPNFVLNQTNYKGEILIAGHNFGCGSSREHAAWALIGYGFKAIISSFFADIFKNNALNNGLVPLEISKEDLDTLFITVKNKPNTTLTIDIENQTLSYLGTSLNFHIDPYKKTCLINGYDDIDFLVNMKNEIANFERLNSII